MDETPQHSEPHERGVGATVGIIIVVILVALGGAYFFLQQQARLHALQQEGRA